MSPKPNNGSQGEAENQGKDTLVSTAEQGIEDYHPSKTQSNITIVSCVR